MTKRFFRWSLTALSMFLCAGLLVSSVPAQSAKPTDPPAPEEGDDDPDASPATQPGKTPTRTGTATTLPSASRAAIDALIDKAGKEPPSWWSSVKLTFPPTLDLNWTQPAPPPYNPNKNIDQYYRSVINPNPARHQEGCKLMQHILTVNKDKPAVQQRAMAMLGRIYSVYLQDHARGAFWFRKAAKAGGLSGRDIADLAYCYYKLGSKDMALAEISSSGTVSTRTVRVLGNMGEIKLALEVAQDCAESFPEDAYLAAGDACRYNGRNAEAITWYQKVLALKSPNSKAAQRLKRYQDRANADIVGVKAFDKLDLKKIVDGTYQGDSIGYRGPVRVAATVKGGRIISVKVISHKEDWPLNALVTVPAQIIEKQSISGVDMTSGATFTAEAALNAASKALGGAPRK